MVDPRMILQSMMKNQNISGNNMFMNALNMANSGNIRGVQNLVENYCKTNGIDIEQAKRQVEHMYR